MDGATEGPRQLFDGSARRTRRPGFDTTFGLGGSRGRACILHFLHTRCLRQRGREFSLIGFAASAERRSCRQAGTFAGWRTPTPQGSAPCGQVMVAWVSLRLVMLHAVDRCRRCPRFGQWVPAWMPAAARMHNATRPTSQFRPSARSAVNPPPPWPLTVAEHGASGIHYAPRPLPANGKTLHTR